MQLVVHNHSNHVDVLIRNRARTNRPIDDVRVILNHYEYDEAKSTNKFSFKFEFLYLSIYSFV